ncbi:ferredoxin [Mycobacterium paraintracellulare]|uniref:ferredoxin n=1 Tax=Mycobacterium paraintracellulare TaxID=1138383 RepID=UPI001925E159|nr:ferredoxin [Mycobacterium paraintracellulare]BCP14200.1 hypothetical protein MINTM021_11090 [Mycobacterium paraintracellulare]
MKVILDDQLCVAHGECVLAAPEIFALSDEDAVVRILDEEPDEELRPKLEQAVRVCPADALRIE